MWWSCSGTHTISCPKIKFQKSLGVNLQKLLRTSSGPNKCTRHFRPWIPTYPTGRSRVENKRKLFFMSFKIITNSDHIPTGRKRSGTLMGGTYKCRLGPNWTSTYCMFVCNKGEASSILKVSHLNLYSMSGGGCLSTWRNEMCLQIEWVSLNSVPR